MGRGGKAARIGLYGGPMAGYSERPLVRKLGIKPDHRLVVIDAPPRWSLAALPPGVEVTEVTSGSAVDGAEVVVVFVRAAAHLPAVLALGPAVFPDGMIWVAWPRKAGAHVSDVTEQAIRDTVLPVGLVDVKVAALDDDWSGLKVVWRKERRSGPPPST